MTKRISAIILAILLILSIALIPAGAAASFGCKVDDRANLLTAEEEEALTSVVEQVSTANKCNLAVVTVDNLSGAEFYSYETSQDFADMYYETYYGQNTDGIVILLTLSNEYGNREIYYSTSGKCIKRLSDSEREAILDDIIDNYNPDSVGYYQFLAHAVSDLQNALPPHVGFGKLLLALLIGFGVAMITMLILRSQLKSVKMERGAANYVRNGSMNVTASRDTYLYRTVSRTARPKSDSGSSSHSSSGGGSHGGGGRSF